MNSETINCNMRIFFDRLILLILFLAFSINGMTQTIPIKSKLEKVFIKNDSSFASDVSVVLKKSAEPIFYPIIYDNELEEIYDIQVYKKKGRHFKLVKRSFITEEDVELDVIASKKVKIIFIPSETEAKITYKIKCKELMYFSSLRFFSNNEIDTLKYQINVPNKFNFSYNTIYKDSLDFIEIDSMKMDSLVKWKIKVKPKKTKPNPLLFFGIYRNLKEPLMRTLITPVSYKNNAKNYMNDWYLKQIEKRRGLSEAATKKIDELTDGVSDPKKIMEILFSYVKSNFKYVAIEIGMGAFIPTHVKEVFTDKQGDCKDLSNFLSEALNYKGVKSNIALAATYDHISDCDFPSLSSANHVICVAYINDKPILLDPTDPIHMAETPVQSLQRRSIFIINSNGGEFYKATNFSAEQNLIKYDINLEADSNLTKLEGKFKVNYEGISGNFLRRELYYTNNDKINNLGKKHYEFIFGDQAITDFKLDFYDKSFAAEGKISVNGKSFIDGENRFLFLDFLPQLIESERRGTLLEGNNLGYPFKKKVNLKIKTNDAIHPFKPVEHNFTFKGVSFNLKISNPSEFVIECKYEFIFDHIFIDKENLESINEILKSFKKITNEPIIYKKKS